MPGYLTRRVVQVHPLLLCNLRCAHCYSSSAPGLANALPVLDTLAALRSLRDEGYEAVSVSGGEPFLYRDLDRLVGGAKDAGYAVNVITNGTVLAGRRQRAVLPLLDFVAVSVDGSPPNHDRIRGSDGAFDAAEQGLDVIAEAGVPFGVTFCVTTSTLEDVPWVYDLAVRKGARLLNLRPLAAVGRATDMAAVEALAPPDQGRLLVLANLLDGMGEGTRVRVDLVPARRLLDESPDAFPVLSGEPARLGDWVNPLVVHDRGPLLPFAYGVHASYALGDVFDGLDGTRPASVERLVRATLEELERLGEGLVDWFDLVTATSHAVAEPV